MVFGNKYVDRLQANRLQTNALKANEIKENVQEMVSMVFTSLNINKANINNNEITFNSKDAKLIKWSDRPYHFYEKYNKPEEISIILYGIFSEYLYGKDSYSVKNPNVLININNESYIVKFTSVQVNPKTNDIVIIYENLDENEKLPTGKNLQVQFNIDAIMNYALIYSLINMGIGDSISVSRPPIMGIQTSVFRFWNFEADNFLIGFTPTSPELYLGGLVAYTMDKIVYLTEDYTYTSANLTGANLTGANLTGANLTGANLTSAELLSWVSVAGATDVVSNA